MAPLTLYFDRNFGKRFPQALRTLGLHVQFQHDRPPHFPQDTPDDIWLSVVGKKGWIVCSHDRKFHLLPAELSAIKQHNIGCFYLWGANASPWEKAQSFARAWDRIRRAAIETPRPFVYHVAQNGALRKVSLADIPTRLRRYAAPRFGMTVTEVLSERPRPASPA